MVGEYGELNTRGTMRSYKTLSGSWFGESMATAQEPTVRFSDGWVYFGDGWGMTQNQVIGAMKRGSFHSLTYQGPINENNLIDPWNLPRPIDSSALNVATIGTRTDYVREPRRGGTSGAWKICAAEVVLANEVPNWSDFCSADAKYAVTQVPNNEGLVMVWVWFKGVRRNDNCFAFSLEAKDLTHRAWLWFLERSRKLSIRNGVKASGLTVLAFDLEHGASLGCSGRGV
jgi:hypothetical protein